MADSVRINALEETVKELTDKNQELTVGADADAVTINAMQAHLGSARDQVKEQQGELRNMRSQRDADRSRCDALNTELEQVDHRVRIFMLS